jgi:hypothetical protein
MEVKEIAPGKIGRVKMDEPRPFGPAAGEGRRNWNIG